ncbi:MAG TPA: T9SS type A sorting domain-containing protein, partial [bacterium]
RHVLKNGAIFDETTFAPNPKESISSLDDMNGMQLIPPTFQLYQNYPNPFNPTTTIQFRISTATHVKLNVLDLTGRLVSNIINGYRNAGTYQVKWECMDSNGFQFSSGVYFYRLQVDSYDQVKKMIVLQ